MHGGWVYMMTNKPRGTLYVGVTADLARRVWEHRNGIGGSFTRKYNLHRLVWAERHEDVAGAIQRETSIKRWPRAYKVRLIEEANPAAWDDLYAALM